VAEGGGSSVVAARRFPLDPASGGLARAFVVGHLAGLGMAARADDVELVVGELVTNVFLHARTDCELRLIARSDGVRIELADGSPTLPTPGTLDARALSGRGLLLLQAIVSRWGAHPLPEGGKIVWCELGREPVDEDLPLDVDALLASWDDEPAPAAGPAPALIEVVVPDLPVGPLLRAKSQMEDLLRELQLLLLQHPDPAATSPELLPYTRLARRLDAAATQFAEGRRQVRQQALAADMRGLDLVTVHLRLTPQTAAAAPAYLAAVEDAEQLSVGSAYLLAAQDSHQLHTDLRRRYLSAVVRSL